MSSQLPVSPFPPKNNINYGPVSHDGTNTVMTAKVNWGNESYTITWRKAGQYTEGEARAEIEGKLDYLFMLHTRYLVGNDEVRKVSFSDADPGSVKRTIETADGKTTTKGYKKFSFDPSKTARTIDNHPLKQEIDTLQARIQKEEKKTPRDAKLIEQLKADEIFLKRKRHHLQQRVNTQTLWNEFVRMYGPNALKAQAPSRALPPTPVRGANPPPSVIPPPPTSPPPPVPPPRPGTVLPVETSPVSPGSPRQSAPRSATEPPSSKTNPLPGEPAEESQ